MVDVKEHDGGRDAVYVVVAVHGNALAASNGGPEPLDADVEIGKQRRIVEMLERGIQESAGRVGRRQPALYEQARGYRADPELGGEHVGRGLVAVEVVPDQTHHGFRLRSNMMIWLTAQELMSRGRSSARMPVPERRVQRFPRPSVTHRPCAMSQILQSL